MAARGGASLQGVCPRPRGATAGVVVYLQGRPRPLLGGGEPCPSLGAFPFSAAENLLTSAMDTLARWWRSKEEEGASSKKTKMG